MTWLVLALTLAAGWLAAHALVPFPGEGRWLHRMQSAGFAVLFGPGIVSMGALPMAQIGAANPTMAWVWLMAVLAVCIIAAWLIRPHPGDIRLPESENTRMLPAVLWTAVAVAAVVFAFRAAERVEAHPLGGWDAMGFWNARAVQIASGPRGWAMVLGLRMDGFPNPNPHPSYPLFISGWLGIDWLAGGGRDDTVPRVFAWLAPLGTLLLLGGSVAQRQSRSMAALACLVLLGTYEYAYQVGGQYSDLWLALAMLASAILLDRAMQGMQDARSLLALGFTLGLCVWIKNEGWPPALAAMGVVLWKVGRDRLWMVLAGAAPAMASTLLLKALAAGVEWFIPRTLGEVIAKVSDPSRWQTILAAAFDAIASWGPWWSHPVLLIAILALVLRLAPDVNWSRLGWLSLPGLVLLAGYLGAYLITQFDLAWHLRTSILRFSLQPWPAAIWLLLAPLRSPESRLTRAS